MIKYPDFIAKLLIVIFLSVIIFFIGKIYIFEAENFNPFMWVLLGYNNYIINLSDKYLSLPDLNSYLSNFRAIYIFSGPISAFTFLLPFIFPFPLVSIITIQRILTTGLNIFAGYFIYEIARKRDLNIFTSSILAIISVFCPFYFIKITSDIVGPAFFFMALSIFFLDRKNYYLFGLFIIFMSLTHPLLSITSIFFLLIIYRSNNEYDKYKLKKILIIQVIVALIPLIMMMVIILYNPQDLLGGTPYSRKSSKFLKYLLMGDLKNIFFTYKPILFDLALIFSVFGFVPLFQYKYLIPILPNISYYIITEMTYHGDIPALIFFLILSAIRGFHNLVQLIQSINKKFCNCFSIIIFLIMLILGVFVSLNVKDRLGMKTYFALYKVNFSSQKFDSESKLIYDCIKKIPKNSVCISSQFLSPYLENAEKVLNIESILDNTMNISSKLEKVKPNCLLIDLKMTTNKEIENDSDKYKYFQNWLYPKIGEYQPFHYLSREELIEIIKKLVEAGLDKYFKESIENNSNLSCSNERVIMVLK